MRRQQIYLMKSQNLHRYNVPEILFNENVVVIVYDQFTPELCRYIHMDNLFVIPHEILDKFKGKLYSIEDNEIRCGDNVVCTDGTLNGESYLPMDALDMGKVRGYEKWFNRLTEHIPHGSFNDLVPHLQDIKVKHNSYKNVLTRLKRLEQFGHGSLSRRLFAIFDDNIKEFDKVASLSIQTHDFDSKKLDIKVKLDRELYVYEPDGYHTWLDTFTKRYFYGDINRVNVVEFYKLLSKYPVVVTFYGIINYILSHNIHRKTNRHDDVYKILLRRLKYLENKASKDNP